MIQVIQQHFGILSVSFTVLIIAFMGFKIYKFKKMTELDKAWRKYHENGQIAQEGMTRNIWDYSFFPGISRLWYQSEWQTAVAMLILLFLLCLYLYTKDDKLFTLLGLNFGIVIGMMIKRS
jgi:hypothetical protein